MTINNKQIDLLFFSWLSSHKNKKKKVFDNLRFIFKNNDIEIFYIKRDNYKVYAFEEFYSENKNKVYDLIKKFNNYFQVINHTKSELLILFDGRLFKIYFEKKYPKKIKSISIFLIFFHRIKFIYRSSSFFNFILSYINRILFNNYRELTYDQFKEIKLKYNYIDSNVRFQNLDLITNHRENLKIIDILNFFKSKKNKNKILKNIFFKKSLFFKSLNSKIPIYVNLNYWSSSNFYLISNIIYGFYNKKFQYEAQCKKNNFYKVFLKKKINTTKNEAQIKKIISPGDMVIINNNPYSSRNRLLAMIGHILNGGKFIKIKYKKNYDTDLYKEKLINFFAEFFSIYKYSNAKIFNLDSNYTKVFRDRGLNLIYKDDYKSIIKKREIYLSLKNSYKKFQFIEVDNILKFPIAIIFLLINKKKKINCFYSDHNRNSTLFNKKKNIRHLVKIFITILKLKPKILFVLE